MTIKVKLRAIQVTLSDGQVVNVHELTGAQFELFLNAQGSFKAVMEAIQAMQMASEGVKGLPTSVPKGATKELFELVATMADMTVGEYGNLPFSDYLSIFGAAVTLLGTIKNSPLPQTNPSPTGATNTLSEVSSGNTTGSS